MLVGYPMRGWWRQPVVTVDVMQAARDEDLDRLRNAYARDAVTLGDLERLTEHVLNGGHLSLRFEALADPDPRSSLAAVLRRGGGNENPVRTVVVDYSDRRWRL
jgi:hypothetical protein